MSDRKTVVEPMLIFVMRDRPTGQVVYLPEGRAKLGTSAQGFLVEYDEAIKAAEERGRQSAIEEELT